MLNLHTVVSILIGIACGLSIGYFVFRFLSRRLGQDLNTAFKALSADALRDNNQSFLALAQTSFQSLRSSAQHDLQTSQHSLVGLVSPLHDALQEVNRRMECIERERSSSQAGLREQIQQLSSTNQELRKETQDLVHALRVPHVRGQWGEVQLRRVVELAGMLEHCDFQEQKGVRNSERQARPDLVVNLPGGTNIVIDAKAPLEAYLTSIDAKTESERKKAQQQLAAHLKGHVEKLSGKAYGEFFAHTPEFVVLFLPGECFFAAALSGEPGLIEFAMRKDIIIATPCTLLALLRSVAQGWDHARIAASAQEIRSLGAELLERLGGFTGHLEDVQRGLQRAVQSYNKAIGSYEGRVLVSARKLNALGGFQREELEAPAVIETVLRQPQEQEGAPSRR